MNKFEERLVPFEHMECTWVLWKSHTRQGLKPQDMLNKRKRKTRKKRPPPPSVQMPFPGEQGQEHDKDVQKSQVAGN